MGVHGRVFALRPDLLFPSHPPMNDTNGTSTRNSSPSEQQSDRPLIGRLYETIARLHATIQSLRASGEELEAECRRLLDENQKLRRRATRSALLDDFEAPTDSDADNRDEPNSNHAEASSTNALAPPQAERFYRQLPGRFPFPTFFRLAEAGGLDTSTARRCLMHYLLEDLLVQSGAYLEKTGGVTEAA